MANKQAKETPAYRAAMACAKAGKPKPGQTVVEMWAEIIERETACADLLSACESVVASARFTWDDEPEQSAVEISRRDIEACHAAINKAKGT